MSTPNKIVNLVIDRDSELDFSCFGGHRDDETPSRSRGARTRHLREVTISTCYSERLDLEARRQGPPVSVGLCPARCFLGHKVNTNPGLYNGAGIRGQAQTRVWPSQREGHRPERGPDRGPRTLGQGHRGDEGQAPTIPSPVISNSLLPNSTACCRRTMPPFGTFRSSCPRCPTKRPRRSTPAAGRRGSRITGWCRNPATKRDRHQCHAKRRSKCRHFLCEGVGPTANAEGREDSQMIGRRIQGLSPNERPA